mmetsp:Transcript_130488/g.225642  ORF Transcript_130488/g.225642 Transcript_130488/m.225642 type:complete len:237 (-) Transcript_130488:2197-2907(-)
MVAFCYQFVYHYPFEVMCLANMLRYPSCPELPALVDYELLSDIHADAEKRLIERTVTMKVDLPEWIPKWLGLRQLKFHQTVKIDTRQRFMHIHSTNLFLPSQVLAIEDCVYGVSKANPNWTTFSTTAFLKVNNFFGLEGLCEKQVLREYVACARLGRIIDGQKICNIINTNPLWRHLEPWHVDPDKPDLNQPMPVYPDVSEVAQVPLPTQESSSNVQHSGLLLPIETTTETNERCG